MVGLALARAAVEVYRRLSFAELSEFRRRMIGGDGMVKDEDGVRDELLTARAALETVRHCREPADREKWLRECLQHVEAAEALMRAGRNDWSGIRHAPALEVDDTATD